MILNCGDVANIKDEQWFVVEFRSTQTIGPTIKRLGKFLQGVGQQGRAIQVFVPVATRSFDQFDLSSDCYLFARCDHQPTVSSLKKVVGLAGMLINENNRKPIKVENDYVATLIREHREKHLKTYSNVRVGSFVRILDGDNRDYCGHVVVQDSERVQVLVNLVGRELLVDTPVENVVELPDVPEEQHVYFYCDLVKEFMSDTDKPEIIKSVLQPMTQEAPNLEPLHPLNRHRSRHETPTAFVRARLVAGEKDIHKVIEDACVGIRDGHLRKPKTPQVLFSAAKRYLVEVNRDKGIKTFREATRKLGVRISLKEVVAICQRIGISFEDERTES